jgi:hypothetical protein
MKNRENYIYTWLWHRSKIYRDIIYWWSDRRYKKWIRYSIKWGYLGRKDHTTEIFFKDILNNYFKEE